MFLPFCHPALNRYLILIFIIYKFIKKKALLSAGPKGNKKGRDADYFIGYEKDI